ncbi:hypothetical protein AMTRI_Chr04g182720 [Amborella trichopoda]|uniref:EF-hand domain-containing protein n=1 Tax=Amborella trichopoda TaxID=13333 RepID=W1NJ82_AMBTC|nr:probable calcium-binding protein CML10 [Amborella trichopoda]ERM95274.1 hypothetical protein AMTR_s00008p00068860 [Amborella trichopoda]|eukprot:XP_006827858.1 probable calcium-binding protein CML10 [Amborella trichopoda]
MAQTQLPVLSRCPSSRTGILNHAQGLLQAFKAFDADGDGLISAPELGGMMESLGYDSSKHMAEEIMKQGDQNKDGLLSLEEFMELNMKHVDIGDLGDILNEALDMLDSHGNEVVSEEELCEILEGIGEGLTPKECQELIQAMDDGDGVVSIEKLKFLVGSLI